MWIFEGSTSNEAMIWMGFQKGEPVCVYYGTP